MTDINRLVLPLFEAVTENDEIKETPRYLGMAFNINKLGAIATCSHLLSNLDKNKSVIAIQMHDYVGYPVTAIKCHDKYDFAIAHVDRPVEIVLPMLAEKDCTAGIDVMAYGVNSNGLKGQQLDLCPRLMKGHVVRIGTDSNLAHARSICEVSFPSLAGFSGTPLLSCGSEQRIAGMLYGNYEASIELFKLTQTDESGSKYNEQIHRIYEFGLAHTALDIRQFLADLKF